MKLLIAGAGGHGRVIADAALASSAFTSIAFLDDHLTGTTAEGWPIIGLLSRIEELGPQFGAFAAGFGNADLRLRFLMRARELGLRCPPLIHPSASVSKRCMIGDGSVVFAGACVNIGARLGVGCIVNTGATVDHDCVLADGVHVSPGSHLAGNVHIGARSWFGIGAVARQGINIGVDAMIGAGAVVVRDIGDREIVVGNPARPTAKLRSRFEGDHVDADSFPRWPEFARDERQAVESVLASGKVNYWTGEEGRSFEREYATVLGRRHAIALMNGTVALELPLRMLGIGPGDEVIVTPRSFIASASCVVLQGARPVFADIDPESGNITAQTIERVLSPRTKAILLVHLGGWPCEMDDILALAETKGLTVIEDCAQAHGATYRDRDVGSFGYAAAFSFCQDKIITTGGEGGLLATDDEEMWSRAWAFKDHGKSFDAVYGRQHLPGFRWLHESFGTNWRMTEAQAAIGRLQLKKLPSWTEKRRANAAVLTQALSGLRGLRVPEPPRHVRHAYYRFYAHIEVEKLRSGWDRDRIVAEVTQRGVPCFSGSCSELYREKAFIRHGLVPEQPLSVARQFSSNSLALLVHPTLDTHHMAKMADVLSTVLEEAIR